MTTPRYWWCDQRFGRSFRLCTCLAIVAVVGGGCHSNTPPERLDGEWSAALTNSGGATARGTVQLVATPRPPQGCEGDTLACATMVRGSHRVDFSRLLGHIVPSPASGAHLGTGGVLIVLGDCCDRGEISLKGEVHDGVFRGRWTEEHLGGGPSGRVVMRRIDPAKPEAARR